MKLIRFSLRRWLLVSLKKHACCLRASLAAALILTGMLATVQTSQAQVMIDTFSDADLSNYNLYRVLDSNTVGNISFSSPSGTLSASYSGSNATEQVLFFNNEGFTLQRGFELQVDGPITRSGSSSIWDLGLAIGATPTSLAAGTSGDTRSSADFLFISYRSPTQLNARGWNGGVELSAGTSGTIENASTLFIARLANDNVELGYYDNNNVRQVLRTVTPASTTVFNNVGFYADLRGDGATISGLDNLRLIPEPSAIALLLGGFGLLAIRRRRRA